jgi:hypothetical protein
MKSWWEIGIHFKETRIDTYPTSMLRTAYKTIVALLSILHGKEYSTQFKESWVPLIYVVTKMVTIFN